MPFFGGTRPAPIELPPISLDAKLEFRSAALADSLSYWKKQAAGRQMPLLSDIRPEEIARLLPFLSLFEMRTQDGEFSLFPRLAGSKFEEVFGPIHKRELHTVLAPEFLERWHGAARAMIGAGASRRQKLHLLRDASCTAEPNRRRYRHPFSDVRFRNARPLGLSTLWWRMPSSTIIPAARQRTRPSWREQLEAATPDGIDVNFENVGGNIGKLVVKR
mgnify:CR=1 FL=1